MDILSLFSSPTPPTALTPDQQDLLSKLLTVDLSKQNLAALSPLLFPSTPLFKSVLHLYLTSNLLLRVPREVLNLETLTTIYVSHNSLSLLPPLHSLRHLTHLFASENRISDFPVYLPGGLRTLDLSRNKIVTIPTDIEHLTRLQFLNMWSNELISIPPEICYLTSLERLWIDGNRIDTLPQSLKLLTSLQEIHAFDNPLHPHELLQAAEIGTIPAISDQLAKSYLKECKKINRTKLIVLGPTNGGKTYLFDHLLSKKKLQNNPGKPQDDYPRKRNQSNPLATKGAAVRQLVNIFKGRKFIFNVWEFGGDPSYYPGSQFFFHEENVIYLLVYNATALAECKFEFYLECIRNKAPHAPVIIIGTHADSPYFSEKYKDYARPKLEKKCAVYNPTAFIEVNVKMTSSLLDLKKLLSKVALENLPTAGQLVPPQFFPVLNFTKTIKSGPPGTVVINSLSNTWFDFRQLINFHFTNKPKPEQPTLADTRPIAEELREVVRIMGQTGDAIYYGEPSVWDEHARLGPVIGSRVVHNVGELLAGVCLAVQQYNHANSPDYNNNTQPDLYSYIPYVREWLESVK